MKSTTIFASASTLLAVASGFSFGAQLSAVAQPSEAFTANKTVPPVTLEEANLQEANLQGLISRTLT